MNEGIYHLSTPIGIHRVMKEPYDDREIFESMDDLWDYCKNGARYDGQKVACILGAAGTGKYIQNFTINNSCPIINLQNGEHIISTGPTSSSGINDSILIYNYNPFALNDSADKRMFNSYKGHYNYLDNPSKFSIFSLIKAFRPSSTYNKYTLIIKEYTTDDITSTEVTIGADELESIINGVEDSVSYSYIISGNTHTVTVRTGDSDYQIKIIVENSSNSKTYNLFPKGTSALTCTKVYIRATSYIVSMGGMYVG